MTDTPSKISALRASIITALATDGAKPKASQDLYELIPSEEPRRISQNLYVLKSDGRYLKGATGGAYKLTELGKKTAEGIRLGEIEVGPKLTGKAAKARARNLSIRAQEPPQEIHYQSLNLSNNAANLADSLSAVIEENKQYRDLLLQLYKTIDKALGLTKE